MNSFRPTKSSQLAAGYDLRSAYDSLVPKRGKQLIKTDLTFVFPENCYGRLAPRSGLSWNHSIDVGAGVIDRDFTGNVSVVLFNHSDSDFVINRGDRICQLICEVILYTELKEISRVNETKRGSSGFGSSGIQ